MRYFIILILLKSIYANQPYSKNISFSMIDKPTLVRLKLDSDIYGYTQSNYNDIRIRSEEKEDEEVGYFIKKIYPKAIEHRKTLKPTHYEREDHRLMYEFKKPFLIEKIVLNIKNRNFSTYIRVFIDDKLIAKNYHIFDYTKETGNQNFTLKIAPIEAKKVVIVYDLNQTEFFSSYKYSFKKTPRPLQIRSTSFINQEKPKIAYDMKNIALLEHNSTHNYHEYIFQTNRLDIDHIDIKTTNHNYKRVGYLYTSDDKIKWHYSRRFQVQDSTLSDLKRLFIGVKKRSKYLKLSLLKKSNTPLDITHIKAYIQPNYLYFIAQKNERYRLYFGEKNLKQPYYDTFNVVQENTPFISASFSKLMMYTTKSKDISFLEKYKNILFNLGIFLAVALLFYIALVLLKEEEHKG